MLFIKRAGGFPGRSFEGLSTGSGANPSGTARMFEAKSIVFWLSSGAGVRPRASSPKNPVSERPENLPALIKGEFGTDTIWEK